MFTVLLEIEATEEFNALKEKTPVLLEVAVRLKSGSPYVLVTTFEVIIVGSALLT